MKCKHRWKYAQQVWSGQKDAKEDALVGRFCTRCKDVEIGHVGYWERATKLNTRRGMVNSILDELVPA